MRISEDTLRLLANHGDTAARAIYDYMEASLRYTPFGYQLVVRGGHIQAEHTL